MRAILVIAAAGLLMPAVANAQTPTLSPGEVVRIWSPTEGLRKAPFVVHEMRLDVLGVLPVAATSPVTRISWTAIDRLDVERGRHSRWRKALIWGGLIGLGSACVTGSLTRKPSSRESTVPLAAWTGFGVGAIIGSRRDPTRWMRVTLP